MKGALLALTFLLAAPPADPCEPTAGPLEQLVATVGALPADEPVAAAQVLATLSGDPRSVAAKQRVLWSLLPGETSEQKRASLRALWQSLGPDDEARAEAFVELLPLATMSGAADPEQLLAAQHAKRRLIELAGGSSWVPMDPRLSFLTTALGSLGGGQIDAEGVVAVRDVVEALMPLIDIPPVAVDRVEQIEIPGPDGNTISARVYYPRDVSEPAPGLVFYYGGAFVLGSAFERDATNRYLAAATGTVVVAPEYRLAPEHEFPAAHRDAEAAFDWVAAHADELGVDRARIAVGGDSAGGNLAASVARARRDARVSPAFQLLVYPWVDLSRFVADGGGGLPELGQFSADLYAGGHSKKDGDLSPLWIDDLSGVAPAHVITAGHDPLHVEDGAFVDALAAAGVPVSASDYPAMYHGFWNMGGLLPDGVDAVEDSAQALNQALSPGSAMRPVKVDWDLYERRAKGSVDRLVSLLTADWSPEEKAALDHVLYVFGELGGGDDKLNYGDRAAIVAAMVSDTGGIIHTAHSEINKRVRLRLIRRIAHNFVNRTYRDTPRYRRTGRRGWVQRGRERRRARFRGVTAGETRKLLRELFATLHVSPKTAQRMDRTIRNIGIGDVMGLEADLAVLKGKFEQSGGGQIRIGTALQQIGAAALDGTAPFRHGVFRDGLPTQRDAIGALHQLAGAVDPNAVLPDPDQAYLGVSGRAHARGVELTHVNAASAAYRFGLREGDVLESVDGHSAGSFADVVEAVAAHGPGDEIDVYFWRDGRRWVTHPVLTSRQ